MGRRPSDDPTKVISLRLPASVLAIWEARAAKAGRPLAAHLQAKLVEAAQQAPF